MRRTIAKFLKSSEYLLHSDIFNTKRFHTDAIEINCGLGERNLLNIAGGISSQGKTVWVYGVGIFVYYRLEQLRFVCKDFGSKEGKIILFNAGKIGYEGLGDAHYTKDASDMMNILDIPFYEPESLMDLNKILKQIESFRTGIYYIQLGRDYDNKEQ